MLDVIKNFERWTTYAVILLLLQDRLSVQRLEKINHILVIRIDAAKRFKNVKKFTRLLESQDLEGEFLLQIKIKKKVYSYIKRLNDKNPKKLATDKRASDEGLDSINSEFFLSMFDGFLSEKKFKHIVESRFKGNYEKIYESVIKSGDHFCLRLLNHFNDTFSEKTCINISIMLSKEPDHVSLLKNFFLFEEKGGEKIGKILEAIKTYKNSNEFMEIFNCKDVLDNVAREMSEEFCSDLPFKGLASKVRYHCDRNVNAVSSSIKDIKEIFYHLAKVDEIKNILEYSEIKAHKGLLEIYIDYNHDNASWMFYDCPKDALGWTPFPEDKNENNDIKMKIYIGRCSDIITRSAVFAHELCHFICFIIFRNEGVPYPRHNQTERDIVTDKARDKYVGIIIATYNKSKAKLVDEPIIDTLFKEGTNISYQKRELLPRVPHMFTFYHGSTERISDLNNAFNELFIYYAEFNEDLHLRLMNLKKVYEQFPN